MKFPRILAVGAALLAISAPKFVRADDDAKMTPEQVQKIGEILIAAHKAILIESKKHNVDVLPTRRPYEEGEGPAKMTAEEQKVLMEKQAAREKAIPEIMAACEKAVPEMDTSTEPVFMEAMSEVPAALKSKDTPKADADQAEDEFSDALIRRAINLQKQLRDEPAATPAMAVEMFKLEMLEDRLTHVRFPKEKHFKVTHEVAVAKFDFAQKLRGDVFPAATVTETGKLINIFAIGGESTGLAIEKADGSYIEIDANVHRIPVQTLKMGTQVQVEGTYVQRHGIERGEYRVLVVTKLINLADPRSLNVQVEVYGSFGFESTCPANSVCGQATKAFNNDGMSTATKPGYNVRIRMEQAARKK